jgi:hypothetical protein
MSKVKTWDELRLCPACGFHKYRLFEVAEVNATGRRLVRMSCDNCGLERPITCPGCGTVGDITALERTYTGGQRVKQAGCDTCNYPGCSQWTVRAGDKPKRKASLRKYIVERQATCSDCGCAFVHQGDGDVHHVAHFGRGGPDILVNLTRLCKACHVATHGKQRRAG